jgi:hypothetical protein
MTLTLPAPPEEGLGVIRAAVAELLSRPGTHAYDAAAEVSREEITAAAPHRVYYVGADAVAGGRLLGAALLTGWRYILLEGERPLLAAELSFDAEGERLEFSHANDGPFVGATLRGVRVAEGLEEIRAGDFELRLLESPGLSLSALWFHAEGRDLLMPLPPAPRGLKPYHLYAERKLLAALGAAAARRMQIRDERA